MAGWVLVLSEFFVETITVGADPQKLDVGLAATGTVWGLAAIMPEGQESQVRTIAFLASVEPLLIPCSVGRLNVGGIFLNAGRSFLGGFLLLFLLAFLTGTGEIVSLAIKIFIRGGFLVFAFETFL